MSLQIEIPFFFLCFGLQSAMSLDKRVVEIQGRVWVDYSKFKKNPKAPKIARTGPKNFPNNSRALPNIKQGFCGKPHQKIHPKVRQNLCHTSCLGYLFQRFRKGAGGRGLATNKPQKRAQNVLQKCVPLLLRGHRKKGTENWPEFLAYEGFPRANPLGPPTPFRNLWLFRAWAIVLSCRVQRCDTYFQQDLVCVCPNEREVVSLGPITRRMVVTPDVDAMLNTVAASGDAAQGGENPAAAHPWSTRKGSVQSRVNFQGEIIYAPPPPPISGHKAFFRGGGWGCIFWGPPRQEFYTPPLFIHPPPLEGYFQGRGGGRV